MRVGLHPPLLKDPSSIVVYTDSSQGQVTCNLVKVDVEVSLHLVDETRESATSRPLKKERGDIVDGDGLRET